MYIWREGGGRGSGGACVCMSIHIYIYLHACIVRGAVQAQARKFVHKEPEAYCTFLHVVKPVTYSTFFTSSQPVALVTGWPE